MGRNPPTPLLDNEDIMPKWFIDEAEEEYMKFTGKPVIKLMYWWPTRTWVIAKTIQIGRSINQIESDPDRLLSYEVELAPTSIFGRYLCYKQLLSGPKTSIQISNNIGLPSNSILELLKGTPECFEVCDKTREGYVWRIIDNIDAESIPWIYNTDLAGEMSIE